MTTPSLVVEASGKDMDTRLVVRAQQGDEGAFRDLTLAVGPRLLGVAFGILRERSIAEDATQQALLQMWHKLPRLRDPARFEAWSYRLLVRICYAEAKRSHRSNPDRVLETSHQPVVPDAFGSIIDRDELERGFRRLSMEQRAVIVLHHYLQLTLDETADALGVPVGTVRSRLYHAVQGMRAALEADARPARPVRISEEVTR
jgi:RNA polymerase sigma factor (sigma-70 family)